MKDPSGSVDKIFSAASPDMGPQYQPYWKKNTKIALSSLGHYNLQAHKYKTIVVFLLLFFFM